MPDKKSESVSLSRGPKICPVCGKASYSKAGIHPQCSALQADRERTAQLKKEKAAEGGQKEKKPTSTWQKLCPKCKKTQHVRKKVCDCGHSFEIQARPPTNED